MAFAVAALLIEWRILEEQLATANQNHAKLIQAEMVLRQASSVLDVCMAAKQGVIDTRCEYILCHNVQFG